LQIDFWYVSDKLTLSDLDNLDKPFTVEEVKNIIFSYDTIKAPGLDGFSFLFYQLCREIIKNDVMKLIHTFYHNVLDVLKINLASICLLPKKRCSVNNII
jgi:hypothetical protein